MSKLHPKKPRARVIARSRNFSNAVIVSHLDDFEEVLKLIPERSKGQRRLLTYLNEHPQAPTGKHANGIPEVGNLSDKVSRKKQGDGINERIASTGYQVRCEKPLVPLMNSFNEKTGRCLWSIYYVFEYPVNAANDSEFGCHDEVKS